MILRDIALSPVRLAGWCIGGLHAAGWVASRLALVAGGAWLMGRREWALWGVTLWLCAALWSWRRPFRDPRQFTPAQRAAVYRRHGWRCTRIGCGRPADEVDHLWPRAFGGPTWVANAAPKCGVCNRAKSDRVVAPGLVVLAAVTLAVAVYWRLAG